MAQFALFSQSRHSETGGTRTCARNISLPGVYKGAVYLLVASGIVHLCPNRFDLASTAHRDKGDLIEAAAAAAADLLHTGTSTSPESRRNSWQIRCRVLARRCACHQLASSQILGLLSPETRSLSLDLVGDA
jgi:hypothetical protein